MSQNQNFFSLPFLKINFFFFWLHWVFVAMRASSSCSEWGYSLVVVRGVLIAVGSLAVEHRLSSCGSQGLVAPWHLKSCWTRDQTCVQ